jgi:nicotinate-nucleotide pyrophosphorylase (carboxylating)
MEDIERFLVEDIGDVGDITSNTLFEDDKIKARIIAKEDCFISGLADIKDIFECFKCKFSTNFYDGDFIKRYSIVADIQGFVSNVFMLERLCLNILSRMSGITSETHKIITKCRKINPSISIAATRKTTPGFRKYEKRAVVLGGGKSHRQGLFDEILIKDNHLKVVGSIEKAITKIRKKYPLKKIEIEVENENDAIIAANLSVDIIMLDNLDVKNAEKISKKIKDINSNILIEISGGINIENVIDYAPFADIISIGYLTHSVKSIDFSLEVS